ncbi:hypothetical protein MBH78_09670 [Oceanimonas sp. NS1]|nr:hypothetical protein [Oceanimonas sp. NS1]
MSGLVFFLLVLGTLLWGLWQLVMWATAANQVPVNSLIIQGEHRFVSRDDMRESVLALPEVGNFLPWRWIGCSSSCRRCPGYTAPRCASSGPTPCGST